MILKQQRAYWSYDGPIDKFPPATPRKDLVDAINVALSYLEKQKKQKPEIKYVYPKFRKGDVIEPITPNGHFTPVRVVDIWDGSYSCRSDDDKTYLSLPIKREDEYRLVEPKHAPDDLQKSFEAGQTSIVDNPEQYGLCKKAEWSEEDDRVFEFAIARVEIYERDFLHGNNEMSERLKALHPRPSWKPSEEQMKALELVVNFLKPRKDTYEPKKITELESLYEQLKKL